MMMDEKELRENFQRLRDADRNRTPGFARTYEGARRARRRGGAVPRFRPLVIAAAAAVVIVAVWMARPRSLSPSETPAIVTWRAPTDVLLDTPGSELLGAMPALGASVLDKMIPTHSMRGS
jgi:hypothetical protein